MKVKADFSSVAGASTDDSRLNLLLLVRPKAQGDLKDFRKVLSRYSSFRHVFAKDFYNMGGGRDFDEWRGIYLNIHEFTRAMEVGTHQTIRKRDAATQTNDATQTDAMAQTDFHNSEIDTGKAALSPSIFSQDPNASQNNGFSQWSPNSQDIFKLNLHCSERMPKSF